MIAATCIIGAGYSFVAGLPLAKDLLSCSVAVVSGRSERTFRLVWSDFEEWKSDNPDGYPEQYLADLYDRRGDCSLPHFSQAVELVAAVLATPREAIGSINPRYAVRITRPSKCSDHVAFWSTITNAFECVAAVTTNYDLLIERALRHRPMRRGYGPGCYYGGIARPQILKGTALPFSVRKPLRHIELTGEIPVHKLHGSLNWSRDGSGLKLYQDMRPAFRNRGDAAIVPPIPEKEVPGWLRPVWKEAEQKLAESECWIVCGYSMPGYDFAMRDMLRRAAAGSGVETVLLLDPFSRSLLSRYQQIAPDARIHCLDGLPHGVAQLRSALS